MEARVSDETRRLARHRWTALGAVLGVAGVGVIAWRVDLSRLGELVVETDTFWLAVVPLAIVLEQLVRAWKWRQLLFELKQVPSLRLLGAIMAGFLAGMLVPASPLVRAWLVARLEGLAFAAVLASVAVDRLIDGVVFAGFVAAVLLLAAFPDPDGGIRLGLEVAGATSLAVVVALLFVLFRLKGSLVEEPGTVERWMGRIPERWKHWTASFASTFVQGVVWPTSGWRRVAIVLASVLMKGIAATHLLWAGLAFGVLLEPAAYLFLIVLLGFVVVVSYFARIPAGFILGAVFALELLGVDREPALAMAVVVHLASLATVAVLGSAALVKHGIRLDELPRAGKEAADGP